MKTDAEPEVDLTQLALIGELTTEDGPWLDDHFVVLVFWDGSGVEISSDSTKAKVVLEALRARREAAVDFHIIGGTSFASRVIYPEELKDRPLFIFRKKPMDLRELWETIKRFGLTVVEKGLAPEVVNYLEAKRKTSGFRV